MANTFQYEVVDQPVEEPGIGSLLQTFTPRPMADTRWEMGLQFQTWDACLEAFTWVNCSGEDKDAAEDNTNTIVQNTPITVYVPFHCSSFGSDGDLSRYRQAAIDALRWQGGSQLEHEFWSGVWAQSQSLENQYLTDATSMTLVHGGDQLPWPAALALLQKDLKACLGDGVGVIHASPALVSMWHMGYAIKEVGGKLRDAFGNYVVAGPGYPGSDPDDVVTDGIEWAYGTGMVDVRVSEVLVIPDGDEALNRRTNEIEYIAEAQMSAVWDNCCHFGVQASIADGCTWPS